MPISFESYLHQKPLWPQTGRHILAQFDDESIIVYQAYRPAIGHFAAKHGYFGGEFRYSRMSWIKPNFLWIMYRSGWGTKEGQEVILALRLRRTFFDSILADAVPSSWDRSCYNSNKDWVKATSVSSVRLQWDPDHHPYGTPLERRAIQLGLRNDTLRRFGNDELLEVIDLSSFVAEQRRLVEAKDLAQLQMPRELVYVPSDPMISGRLRLDS